MRHGGTAVTMQKFEKFRDNIRPWSVDRDTITLPFGASTNGSRVHAHALPRLRGERGFHRQDQEYIYQLIAAAWTATIRYFEDEEESNEIQFVVVFVLYFSMEHLTVVFGVCGCFRVLVYLGFVFFWLSIFAFNYRCVRVCAGVFNRFTVYLSKISAKIEILYSRVSQNDWPKRTLAAVFVFVLNFCTRHALTKYNKHAYIHAYMLSYIIA